LLLALIIKPIAHPRLFWPSWQFQSLHSHIRTLKTFPEIQLYADIKKDRQNTVTISIIS
jgi:hypothetical protein